MTAADGSSSNSFFLFFVAWLAWAHIPAAEGDLKTTVLGGKSDKPAVPVGVSTASHNVEGEMEPGEFRKLQSMLGGAKAKDSHTFVGQRGVTM